MIQQHEIDRPQVSVVCAWYNRADFISDTLLSLLGQTGVSFEIVLVNDGSSDRRVSEKLSEFRSPLLRVIEQPNAGFVAAIRSAIEAARGEFIAIQGAGDVSLPGRLAAQAAVLRDRPEVGIVGSLRKEVVVGGPADGKSVTAGCRRPTPELKDLVFGSNPFSHGEVMFRRSLYDRVGGYRPFFKFAQDRDLWLRMGEHCGLHVIQEVLYERRSFVHDGVSASKEKLLLQQALSTFARQCYLDRSRYGYDPVDRYGLHAGLFRRPSGAYANFIAKLAIQALFVDHLDDAHFYARRALDEKLTLTTLTTKALISAAGKNSVLRRMMREVLRHHPNSSIWAAKS